MKSATAALSAGTCSAAPSGLKISAFALALMIATPASGDTVNARFPRHSGSADHTYMRLFPNLPSFAPQTDESRRSAAQVGAQGGLMDALDNLSDPLQSIINQAEFSPNNAENPDMTAGITFVGQFLDHDITFDRRSELNTNANPNRTLNFRTAAFDLDHAYGRGPTQQRELYEQDGTTIKFRVQTIPGSAAVSRGGVARVDLPRDTLNEAIIGDSRNDENVIVSQFHLAMLRFHNAVTDRLRTRPGNETLTPLQLFEQARRIVRWHYQWIILHEFLPATIGQDRVNRILSQGLQYYNPFAPNDSQGDSASDDRAEAGHARGRHRHGRRAGRNGKSHAKRGTRSAGRPDRGRHDRSRHDSGRHDSGRHDSGRHDSGRHDSGRHDRGRHDSGRHDSGRHDSGRHDSGRHDRGRHDRGRHDSGRHDRGRHDSGRHDSGRHDSGRHDRGRHHRGPRIPIEFSVAAYRYGHSQVRPSYRLNFGADADSQFFAFVLDNRVDGNSIDPDDLRGGKRAPRRFVDWQTFFDLGDGNVRNNKLIDTKISSVLFALPGSHVAAPGLPNDGQISLASRNLIRHVNFGLPSGQAIADAMGVSTLTESDLSELAPFGMSNSTPLWYYVLKEAELMEGGRRLGPVGAGIVGEVFIGLLQADPDAYLSADPDWTPTLPSADGPGRFTTADLLRFAGAIVALE